MSASSQYIRVTYLFTKKKNVNAQDSRRKHLIPQTINKHDSVFFELRVLHEKYLLTC